MNHNVFLNGIPILLYSDRPGYSFIQEYADWIYENRSEFHVSHVITFWQLKSDKCHQDFHFFGGGAELLTKGLDLYGMLSECSTIDSSEEKFSKYRGKNFWADSHILAFPILGIKSPFYNLNGILVLISKDGSIDLNQEQKSLIEILIKNSLPKDVSHPSILACNQILTNKITTSLVIDTSNPEYNQLYDTIVSAIDALSGKNTGNDLGLKHYSQWEILNKETKPLLLSKIFSHNAYSDESHDNTYKHINESDTHYLKSALNDFNKSEESDYSLMFLPMENAESSFKDKTYFEKIGLSPQNGTILTFIERERNTFSSIVGYISCYYVKDLPYTIFTSPSLIIGITQQIYKTIIRVGSYLNLKLLYCFTIHFDEDSNNRKSFFKNISQVLANWNNADECLIYQRQQDGHYQDMLNLDNDFNECDGINFLDLPKRLTEDENFTQFIKNISLSQGSSELTETCDLYFNDNSDGIKSAMVLSSYLSSELVKNILIFINKRSQISLDGTLYNNTFSYYCSLQTCLCGVFLYHYNLLLQSLDSKNYLLKKFRHEIPSCCDAIKDSINQIKESIVSGSPLSKANLLNILNMMDLNNSRISMLAKFFSASEFEDSYFAKNISQTSFKAYMNSYIDIFRTEGIYRGVDVYFDCRDENNSPIKDISLNVSNFFLLSLTNVITNAIRYSAPGTCVNVIAYDNRIEVIDIGIQVRESEKNKIFSEGYRGIDARQVNEKGMGYGLYLTKRVVEAHNGCIEVESQPESNRNHYLEKAIFNYINSLNNEEKKRFIYFDVKEYEYNQVNTILSQLSNSENTNINKSYLNNKLSVIKEWVEYNMKYSTPFIIYPETFFERNIYRVKFSINLN